MAIQDYQSLMLPVLEIAADGQEHAIADVRSQFAEYSLDSEDESNGSLTVVEIISSYVIKRVDSDYFGDD